MMNTNVKKTYLGIRQQLHNLQHSYYASKKLFQNKKTIRLINKSKTMGFFKYYCRNLCLHDVIAGISRLTDRTQTFGKDNLTTKKLIEELKVLGYKTDKLYS